MELIKIVALVCGCSLVLFSGCSAQSASPAKDDQSSKNDADSVQATDEVTSDLPEESPLLGTDTKVSDQRKSDASSATKSARASDESPEEILRAFFLAMLSGDKESLARYSMPHERLDVLIDRQPPQGMLAGMKAEIESLSIKRLPLGARVVLPGGDTVELDATRVNEKRQQVTIPGNPVPFDVVLNDGHWRVNPITLIAARLAAQEAVNRENAKP